MDIALAILAGVVGVLVGGVINVLADDLPARANPRLPHYPDGVLRAPSAWLGIAAFLTGQRESPAGPGENGKVGRLRWRHPVTEVVTGAAFAWLAAARADEPNLWAWFIYMAIMILVTVIDVEHRLILFVVMVPSALFALFVAAVSPEDGKSFLYYVYGGLFGFGLFLVMFLGGIAFTILSRHQAVAFGFGDVMLATVSGLMLGWAGMIPAVFITVFAGAAGALIFIIGRAVIRRSYAMFTPLPYGPYIVLGTLLVLLFRSEVQDFLRMSNS